MFDCAHVNIMQAYTIYAVEYMRWMRRDAQSVHVKILNILLSNVRWWCCFFCVVHNTNKCLLDCAAPRGHFLLYGFIECCC